MNKIKRIFNYFFMALSFVGIISGGLLASAKGADNLASADFSSYNEISNSLPGYVTVNGLSGTDVKDIYLLNASTSKLDLSIADNGQVIAYAGSDSDYEGKTNPTYYTQEVETGEAPSEYYYFNFSTSLSLYKDLTNKQIGEGLTANNLLDGVDISNFTTNGGFPSETRLPQKLNISFSLNTENEKVKTVDSNSDDKQETVVLNEEGIYTLAIPMVVFYTNNGGATFASLGENVVYYTFMVFNSNTYFTSAGVQNVEFSSNLQHSTVLSSNTYSTYHFYNYSDASSVNSLPTLTYDYKYFKINIHYTDSDDNIVNYYIEYQNGKLVILSASGEEITDNISIDARLDSNGRAKITFKDLGQYDVNFEYLYISILEGNAITYQLPLDKNLTSEEFQNKTQKILIFGYQALHSNYTNINESTNQPVESELKTFNISENQSAYDKTADITSLVNNTNKVTSTTSSSPFTLEDEDGSDTDSLKEYVENYLKSSTAKEPISTNQPPVKFITNTTLANVTDTTSAYYKVDITTDEDGVKTYTLGEKISSFAGFNQNDAGTYIYIIQYQYDQYMSQSGVSLGSNYHYQIFYFTITNKVPSVTVYSADENEDQTDDNLYSYTGFTEIYTKGYTNKSVFIINNSDNNSFDASVTITLSAYDYTTRSYYFQDIPIDQLTTIDNNLVYDKHTFKFDGEKEETKQGILIKNTSSYANAKFTITIHSALTQYPSIQTFVIDTNGISGANGYNLEQTSSSNYVLSEVVQESGITNRPIAFSWNKKDSGAQTYAYLKHIPFTAYEGYLGKSNVIYELLENANMLPVSYRIDLSNISQWSEYSRTDISKTIPATNVRTDSGIYILQIYDEAGNYTFKIFMIDNTSPVFVKAIESAKSNTFELISNSSNITVPQDDTDIFIQWGKYKGIYIGENISLTDYTGYQLSGFSAIKDASFENKLNAFFEANTKHILDVPQSELVGHYFMSEISDKIYVKDRATSYSAVTNSEYRFKIDFFETVNGQKEANEGTCKIIIRDASNSYKFADESYEYLNYPSSYISFNITSDLSQFTIYYENDKQEKTNLESEAYSQIADLYYNESSKAYTPDKEGNSETDYRKKFVYYPAVNTTDSLYVSYIPLTSSGMKLESVTVSYYPYEPASKTQIIDGTTYYYHYYTISDKAQIENLELFKYSDGFAADEVQISPLNFGQTDQPLAGKYVLTRTYNSSTEAKTLTEAYDFFSRQITFYVDTNGIISSLTSVSNENVDSSLESLIGGDIVINVHSGEGNSDISVSFPSYSDTTGLNSGSFYTKNSFKNANDLASISLSSNKLPLSLYIPKYKYTISSVKNVSNDFVLSINNFLSYYGNGLKLEKAEGSETKYNIKHDGIIIEKDLSEAEAYQYLYDNLSMSEYELSADILFVGATATKYYGTKFDNTTGHYNTTNDYLTFYEKTKIGGDYLGQIDSFWEPGKYYVTIYQSGKDPQSSMYSLYNFAFEITSSQPEFDVINNDGYKLNQVATENGDTQVYYTNSDTLTIQWTDPTNPYMAKIDKNEIYIAGNHYEGKIKLVSTNTYSISLTNCVNLYKESGLTIQFQYEGYNETYYDLTIKKIYFDVQAPTDNLNLLINNVEASNPKGSFTANMQKKNMRVYTDYTGLTFDPTTDENKEKEASYITNIDNGIFKYYSFSVKPSFFSELQAKLTSEADGKVLNEVYYQKIDNITTYIQATRYTYLNAYSQLSLGNSITQGNFYEIIETDWAGNRTIYVVYVIDESKTEALSYTSNESSIAVTNNQIESGHEIYANTTFNVTSISYNQDPWLYFSFSRNTNGSMYKTSFFKSPYLTGGLVYKISYSNGEASYTQVNINDIMTISKSYQDKHLLTISDQAQGQAHDCYITVYNASLVIDKVTSDDVSENEARISINVPSQEQAEDKETGYVYPVNIEIATYKDGWKTFAKFAQTTYAQWNAVETDIYSGYKSVTFSYQTSSTSNKLIVSALAGVNERVKFVVTDNFGNSQTIIILTGNKAEEAIYSETKIFSVQETDGIAYISSSEIDYYYNPSVYSVNTANGSNRNISIDTSTDGTIIIKPTYSTTKYYDGYVKVELFDIEDEDKITPIKIIYLRIYNILPNVITTATSISTDIKDNDYGIIFLDKNRNNIGEANIKADSDSNPIRLSVKKDGKTYAGPATSVTTYSKNVTVQFPNGLYSSVSATASYNKAITYSAFISSDGGETWQNIDRIDGVNQPASYTITGVGSYIILIAYNDVDLLTNNFKLFEITILDAASSYYYITVDGQQATKSNGVKYSLNGAEYEVTYVVALDYADRDRLNIHENEELGVTVTKQQTRYLSSESKGESDPDVPRGTIVTEIYTFSCAEAKGDFVIIYIPQSSNIVGTITYELASGETASLKDGTNAFIVADKNTASNFNKLKISFSSYYGVAQNAIQPIVYKIVNGVPVKLDPTVYKSNDSISYINLEMSGTYYLQVIDSCTPANSQVFNGATYNGYEFVEITFLSSVPFEVITTDADGQEVITAPIQRAIYNSEVKLKLTNTSSYYLPSAQLTMTATRNGEEINVTATNNIYTFSQPGFYTVTFSATSNTGVEIREESYSFTIVNKNESRYAFEFSEYGNYYIEKVLKDGKDVTEDLLKYSNFKTITIGTKRYLSSINLNHLDEKTGDGKYDITINLNNSEYASVIGESFSFSLWINLAKPPINVSIAEGGSTTSNILVTFNVENFYNAVGDCYIKVGSLRKDYTSENIDSYSETDSITITGSGTYYIQVYTQSGHLLYSYKVTKTEPLNTFAILAIVLGVLAAGAVIFITIKLRKRQKVK